MGGKQGSNECQFLFETKDWEQIYNSLYRHHFSDWRFRGVIPKVLNLIHKRNGTAGCVGWPSVHSRDLPQGLSSVARSQFAQGYNHIKSAVTGGLKKNHIWALCLHSRHLRRAIPIGRHQSDWLKAVLQPYCSLFIFSSCTAWVPSSH